VLRAGDMTTATTTIPIEIVSWVTKFVGGDGSGRRLFDEPLGQGATVRSLLRGDQIGEHIEVLVNDAVLGVSHSLDSRLAPGDRITLLGQYMGG